MYAKYSRCNTYSYVCDCDHREVKILPHYDQLRILEAKLKIAVEALEICGWLTSGPYRHQDTANKALKDMGEVK